MNIRFAVGVLEQNEKHWRRKAIGRLLIIFISLIALCLLAGSSGVQIWRKYGCLYLDYIEIGFVRASLIH